MYICALDAHNKYLRINYNNMKHVHYIGFIESGAIKEPKTNQPQQFQIIVTYGRTFNDTTFNLCKKTTKNPFVHTSYLSQSRRTIKARLLSSPSRASPTDICVPVYRVHTEHDMVAR